MIYPLRFAIRTALGLGFMGLDSNGPWQLRSWLYLYDFNVKVLAHFGQVIFFSLRA